MVVVIEPEGDTRVAPSGTVGATGVTLLEGLDAAPVPTVLVAVTVKV